jgi:two-component system chemotaxis response regulator CheY
MTETRKRVLIVDDEGHARVLLRSAMQALGCEVAGEGRNGVDAVDLFRRMRPDLLLLDINMPVKTGEEALAEIMREFPEARVVMLTSVVDTATVEQCIGRGATSYIRKDTPLAEIKAIAARALGL